MFPRCTSLALRGLSSNPLEVVFGWTVDFAVRGCKNSGEVFQRLVPFFVSVSFLGRVPKPTKINYRKKVTLILTRSSTGGPWNSGFLSA